MNKVEKHETDEECNVCETKNVINEYGRKSCDNYGCQASKHSTDIHWNSSPVEIEEYYSDVQN